MADIRDIPQPRRYRELLLVDTDHGPRPLGDVMDPWQAADFAVQDSAWRRLAGQPTHPEHLRFWLERPRGHSKTSDIAVSIVWALLFSRRRLSGVAAAADGDQARLLRNAISRLANCNEWIGRLLDIQASRIVNAKTGSELQIISSDAGSSYGLLPDFVVADELCHWRSRDLWDSLLSSAAKRSHCLLLVITNAGFRDSWQWTTRESVREDPAWCFRRLDGPCASWIGPATLAEQRRLLPAFQFQRLWLNQWTVGTDNPLVSEDDLAAAITLPGPLEGWPRDAGPFVAGLDIATRADKSALCVIGCDLMRSKVRLARVKVWDPSRYGGQLPLSVVERDIVQLAQDSRLLGIAFDPFEAALLSERLAARGIRMFRFPWSVPNKQKMTLTCLEMFRHRRVSLYPDADLIRDLRRSQVKERAERLTFELPRDENGHGDSVAAFLMALQWSVGTRKDCIRNGDWEKYARAIA